MQKGEYRLTVIGKEYANRMDTDTNEIERQPKISVLLLIERNNNGETEYLLQQRLKQPFFGFWGMMSGKVKFGDSFETTAQDVASRWITSFCAVVPITQDLHNQSTVLIPNQ